MAAKKPNILILWGDDIGWWNISFNSRGQMGYRTPNIDRVANEGVCFTDYYAQQSCTAGRASFITGQNPIRTGLTKVGMPGAAIGLQKEDPTIAEMLKPLGYATGQFGKNHLGDRDEFLPTMHGFDEFFGNLYHLNAEEEPELPDYPKDPAFKKAFGPRGVLHCIADGKGGQEIKDTGPLTKKRMETIDEEITDRALAWMEKQAKADQPFFLWYNSTAMHFRTHVAEKNLGKSGQDPYSDRMVVHDEQIGQMLDKLDELGIADNTIVMYSTDNGPENDTWPDGANTPFRSQKDTNWEGGWRVPCFFRWPGKIKAGSVLNGIVSHVDMLPTLLAAAGDSTVKEKLLEGYTVGGKTYKVHLDGYNMIPYLTGEVKESPRNAVFYYCGCRTYSICAGTRSNGQTSTRIPITTGWSITCRSCIWCKPWWLGKSRISSSIRHVRSRHRSTWTRCWPKWPSRTSERLSRGDRERARQARPFSELPGGMGPWTHRRSPMPSLTSALT
jgi:arylsulfatase A-like enzyme